MPAVDAGGDLHTAAWEPGSRLLARGEPGTLIDVQRGDDCVALHLQPDDPSKRARALLVPFDRFQRLPTLRAPRIVGLPPWIRHLGRLVARARPAGALEAAASTGIRLLAYQLEPALAVLRHGATRVLVADGVGLGKTIQAGILVAELRLRTPGFRAMVLVPAGLRDQWAHELDRLFGLSTVAADAAWLRAVTRDRPSRVNPWCLPGIYLASQDFVKRPEVLRPLEEVTWDLLVVDEAHLSSSRSDRRAAAQAVGSRASRLMLLTATPPYDDRAEFTSLCDLGRIDPSEQPIVLFKRARGAAGGGLARRSVLLAVRPTDAELHMHDLLERYTAAIWRESGARGDDLARLAAIVLRKRALSSASSLAASIRRRLALLAGRADTAFEQLLLPLADEDPLDDAESAAVLGAPGLAQASREQRLLAAIAEAAQRASRAESKTRFVRRLLERIHEPAIVFTEYRDTLQRLGRALSPGTRPLLLLHGGMSPSERSRVQTAFNGENALLLATDAAAEGLNLHMRCRLVIHYELPWSATRLEQRAGRVDRLGQNRRVHELGLVAATTAERLVLAPLMRRAWRLQSLDERGSGLVAGLTESRVAEIVIGGAPHTAVEADAPTAGHLGGTRILHLRAEAIAEARRLGVRRAQLLNMRLPATASISRPLVSSIVRRRSALPDGLLLVYLITLTSPAGLVVHSEVVTFVVELRSECLARARPGALRTLVRPFVMPAHPAAACAIRRAVDAALEAAYPIHRRVEASIRQRRLLMEQVRAAAARRLVQAGLFDRPIRRDNRRPVGAASTTSGGQPGSLSASALGVDVTLAAALRVVGR